MPAPLEATETLLPNLMDTDRIRYLFETEMRVMGKFCVRSFVVVYKPSTIYQLEERDAR